ncbi:MAG: flagellar basal body rod protein FlgB [Clostridiales bacterium]|nr:flagellar basal body rod protein FlgB [Clostridiales bacterium]
MDFLSNNSLLLMEKSMDFLWTKQAAISDNIANVETPNYKPKVVTFEETVRARLKDAFNSKTSSSQLRNILNGSSFAVVEPQEVTRMDDNGVNATEQMVELVRNAYQIQYVMESISRDLSVMQSVVRGQ